MERSFHLEVEMGNAAFEDDEYELVRILGAVADMLRAGRRQGTVRDSNGNTVGDFEVVSD